MSDPIFSIGGVEVVRAGAALRYTSGLAVDADGAPDCYAPPGSGLTGRDALANAGRPGRWWGIVTKNGAPDGEPVVQAANDPCPGYYVSATALGDPHLAATNPRRYVDSSRIPYLSIPPELTQFGGVHVGDVALVEYREQWSPAIVADVGPRRQLGEGSIALARALGIDDSPRHGGVGRGVFVTVWPGSRTSPAWPRSLDSIAAQVEELRKGLARVA